MKLYYDRTGVFSQDHSWRIDTINISVLPDSINVIHVLPYSFDGDTCGDGEYTTFEGRDTVLLTALSINRTEVKGVDVLITPNPVKDVLRFQTD